MHSYIINGGTKEDREKAITQYLSSWKTHPVDCISLMPENEEHIGIDAVRMFQKRLTLAPLQSARTVGVIRDIQRLTTEAQHALLKLLEEPPPHAYILCETDSINSLLPTIISRCEVVTLDNISKGEDAYSAMKQTLTQLLTTSPAQKLKIIDTIAKDRITAKQWVREACACARLMLLSSVRNSSGTKNEHQKLTQLIRLLVRAQGELEVNVNPKLTLDSVFLSV